MTSYEMFLEKFKKRYQEVHNLTDKKMRFYDSIILDHAFQCAIVLMFNTIITNDCVGQDLIDLKLKEMIK